MTLSPYLVTLNYWCHSSSKTTRLFHAPEKKSWWSFLYHHHSEALELCTNLVEGWCVCARFQIFFLNAFVPMLAVCYTHAYMISTSKWDRCQENIVRCQFEKYLHDMDLKHTEHVETQFSFFINKPLSKFRYLELFWQKIQFLTYISLKINVSHVFITSLWCHMLNNFYDLV